MNQRNLNILTLPQKAPGTDPAKETQFSVIKSFNMDVGMHHAKKHEIPLAILSRILAQSCVIVQCHVSLTTVVTAPGFCTLRALTTWNTSTTPSVLHLSMVVAMAQNIPDLLTVSLQEIHESWSIT